MRSLFLVLGLSLVACKSSALKGDGVLPDPVAVGSFARIHAAGPVDVDVTVGGAPSVAVACTDGPPSRVTVEVKDDALFLESPSRTKCKATVSMPSLVSIAITGSGDMTVHGKAALGEVSVTSSGDVAIEAIESDALSMNGTGSGDVRVGSLTAKAMKIDLLGSGDVELAGTADKLDMKILGSGDLKAKGLVAGELTLNLTGSGDAVLGVSRKADVSILGSGDARISGHPAEKIRSIRGSGSVTFE